MIQAQVSADTARKFKLLCDMAGKTQREVLKSLIEEWIENAEETHSIPESFYLLFTKPGG